MTFEYSILMLQESVSWDTQSVLRDFFTLSVYLQFVTSERVTVKTEITT